MVNDAELYTLTVKELLELKDRIDLAVRAAIRAKRTGTTEGINTVTEAAPTKIDLERERDAWLSAKR